MMMMMMMKQNSIKQLNQKECKHFTTSFILFFCYCLCFPYPGSESRAPISHHHAFHSVRIQSVTLRCVGIPNLFLYTIAVLSKPCMCCGPVIWISSDFGRVQRVSRGKDMFMGQTILLFLFCTPCMLFVCDP